MSSGLRISNHDSGGLWNGVWHYKKLRKQHSVEQVQNRDKIKIKEILNSGYNYIVVKDFGNRMTPEKALGLIENCITTNTYNLILS